MKELSRQTKSRLLHRYGNYALITGASSGMGMEIAKNLADAGFNLILHGRDEERLQALKDQIKFIHQVDVHSVSADLSQKEGINELLNSCDRIPVSMLVLSAGYGTSGAFLSNNLNAEFDMLEVNIKSVTALCHYYGRVFMDKQKGAIILFSSLVAFQGTPYAAIYAASKAYIQSFGEAFAEEVKDYNIDVLLAAPGPVRSGFEERAGMKMNLAMSPKTAAIAILNSLGKRKQSTPGFLSKILTYSLATIPRPLKVIAMKQIMGRMTRHQKR